MNHRINSVKWLQRNEMAFFTLFNQSFCPFFCTKTVIYYFPCPPSQFLGLFGKFYKTSWAIYCMLYKGIPGQWEGVCLWPWFGMVLYYLPPTVWSKGFSGKLQLCIRTPLIKLWHWIKLLDHLVTCSPNISPTLHKISQNLAQFHQHL